MGIAGAWVPMLRTIWKKHGLPAIADVEELMEEKANGKLPIIKTDLFGTTVFATTFRTARTANSCTMKRLPCPFWQVTIAQNIPLMICTFATPAGFRYGGRIFFRF